ncbi:MAG: alanine:cation symporter family protein [Desulfobacteraceae bacterium]|nr:alanine:cation symporter family protein [Desulfobacteraceae bacterium]
MLGFLENIVSTGNTFLWSYVLIVLLIAIGIYFTIRTNFVQFRFLGEMIRLLGEGAKKSTSKDSDGNVSSFQAFCISTASRVGTGNLAGVAIAIAIGGPGAVFWMWMLALVSASSGFVESTLAQIYKVKDKDGYRGGPAYYMEKALGMRGMGIVFSILITICFGLVFNSVQANTITLAFEHAFGIDRLVTGLILAILAAFVIFGGVKRVAKTSEIIVPVMAVAYLLVALFVIGKNISQVPAIFSLIIHSAFGLKEAVGGGMGIALMQGIKRGLFSNEAGMGSAPNAAATADVSHPVKQGFVQTLGVFTDTILICSATAFIILLSGAWTAKGLTGIQLTQAALSSQVGGWGNNFIALCIMLFAFSSIVGNYYYGESNIEFINTNKKWLFFYRIAVVAMVLMGSIAKVQVVWNMADLFMGSMALINLIAIVLLGKIAFAALKDYARQKKEGKDPVFTVNSIEGLKNVECWGEKLIEKE